MLSVLGSGWSGCGGI